MGQYTVDGKIGSGKTYYCLNFVLRKYYNWDEVIEEYVPKRNIVFVSNIDGLKIDHVNLKKEIEKFGIEKVFHDDYIDKVREQYRCVNIIFIIDEVQKLFGRKFYNESVFNFFQLQRHSGVDFFIITQDVYSVVKEITTLSEYTIHALSRSTGSGLSFSYKKIINEEVVKRIVLKKDKRVFRFYKSFNFDELEKPRPVYLRFAAIGIGLFIGAALLFKFMFSGILLGQSENSITPYAKANKKVEKVIEEEKKEGPRVIKYDSFIHSSSLEQKKEVKEKERKEEIVVERIVPVKDDSDCKLYLSITDQEGRKIEKYKCDGYNVQYIDGVKEGITKSSVRSEGRSKLSGERRPSSESSQERLFGRS
ncbi:MAG: hypothetical protein A2163_09660 [Actinobacteria bacterium RBG_13_35_12]|nr:MAG: hypothetical protein A2163_09660 [Actinobacteria bacterium RBG_13_35_12]